MQGDKASAVTSTPLPMADPLGYLRADYLLKAHVLQDGIIDHPLPHYGAYVSDNCLWARWFEERFVPTLRTLVPALAGREALEALGQEERWINIALTGSRSMDLAYPHSDMEFALVLPSSPSPATPIFTKEDITALVAATADAMRACGLSSNVSVYTTKAGLPLCIAKDTAVGMWKLEFTVRTPEEHAAICAAMERRHEWGGGGAGSPPKLAYIQKMEAMALELRATESPDEKKLIEARMAEAKAWLKVLPEKK